MKAWKPYLWPVAIVLIAVPVFAFAEASFSYLETLVGESSNTFGWTFRRFLVPWGALALLAPLIVLLARRLPLAGPHPWRNAALHAVAAVLIGATHLFLDVFISTKLLYHSQNSLLGFTGLLISRYMLQDVFLYWTVVGTVQAWWHHRALRETELAEARLATELAEARLRALQARLEPHFLFNTLNTAVMLVRGDRREQAVDVLLELSELLRSVLRGAPGGDHEVPLEQEWEFIRRYLALEQARFGDRLSVELGGIAGLERAPVPFLILQPLVENALRHGIARRADQGPGRVSLSARADGARLILEVGDNGPGPASHGAPGGGLGTANVRARLEQLYGAQGRLSVEPGRDGGTLSRVTLPRGA